MLGLATHVACGSVNETSLGGLRLPPLLLELPPSSPLLSSSLRAVSRGVRYSRTARDASSAFGHRRKLPMHPTQVEHGVDLPDQMVGWNNLIEIKGIEELAL